jgi:demethylmacrocin O-methyltransferase
VIDTATGAVIVSGIGDLAEIAERTGTDKLLHGYCPHYEDHLRHLRHQPIELLEVGVYRGESLRMWAEYFPAAVVIEGVDIDMGLVIDPGSLDPRIELTTVDVKAFVAERHYDVVIDDGSHEATDIVAAVDRLWRYVKLGGWYVIEDLQTQFSAQWGGGPRSPALVKVRNALYELLHDQPTCPLVEFHAYPQIVFLRKVAAPDDEVAG